MPATFSNNAYNQKLETFQEWDILVLLEKYDRTQAAFKILVSQTRVVLKSIPKSAR